MKNPKNDSWWESLPLKDKEFYLNNPAYSHYFKEGISKVKPPKPSLPKIPPVTPTKTPTKGGEPPTKKQKVVSPATSSVGNTDSYLSPDTPASSQSSTQQSSISSTSVPDETMPLTGTGKETADGGPDSMGMEIYEIERPLTIFGRKESVYTKSHKFMTFGFANTILTTQSNGATILFTYLAEVPVHIPALYLNPSEFALIPNGSHVKHLKVEVFYRGTTIQFETANTATGLATLNQINDIGVAVGLNKSGQGSNYSPNNFTAGQPMICNGVRAPKYAPVAGNYRGMVRDYYGSSNTDSNFRNDIPKHQVGRQTFLYNYWALTAYGNPEIANANIPQSGGFPCLTTKIKQYDGKTVVNKRVVLYEYSPKMAPIKEPLKTYDHGAPAPYSSSTLAVLTNGSIPSGRTVTLTQSSPISSGGYTTSNAETSSSSVNTGVNYNIYTPIEKSQYLRTGYWGQMEGHCQPSLHVGVQPVPALSTGTLLTEDNQFNSWTDTRAYWEVVTTMVVVEHQPTAYPHSVNANVPFGDNILRTGPIPNALADPVNDGATFAGLYTGSTAPVPN